MAFDRNYWRRMRKACGFCGDCHRRLAPGLLRCAECRAKTNARNQLGKRAKLAAGICRNCPKSVAEGSAHCAGCLDRMTARRYRITVEEVQQLKALPCEGCDSREAIHIDHCHKTKQVRGVLCKGCNQALGLVRENILTLERLITYLRARRAVAEFAPGVARLLGEVDGAVDSSSATPEEE